MNLRTRLLALLISFYSVSLGAIDLPDIGESSTAYLSPHEDKILGIAFMKSIRQHLPVLDDPLIAAYIQSMGNRLVSFSQAGDTSFHFFVVGDAQINAFAGPGGHIGINGGLILMTKTEAELASVVAHEIAHVTQHHLARAFESSSQMNIPMMAAFIAAIVLANQEDGQIGEAAIAVTAASSVQTRINFTRRNEQEADSIGLQLLVDSGHDPQGMPAFFRSLLKYSRIYQNQQPEFLQTHPVTLSRIAETRNRADQHKTPALSEQLNYQLMRARLRVLTDKHQALAHYQNINKQSAMMTPAHRYGYALALHHNGKQQLAYDQASKLIELNPEHISYQLLMAAIQFAQGDIDASLTRYQQVLNLYPLDGTITLFYAQHLIQAGQARRAISLLNDYRYQKTANAQFYALLAQAEFDSGHETQGHQARAEYYALLGEYHSALNQLDFALKALDKQDTTSESQDTTRHQAISRLNARIKQLKETINITSKTIEE